MTLLQFIFISGHKTTVDDSDSDSSNVSLVVSVAYLWHHIDKLGLVPKVYITEDFDHWTTGSFVKDIPADFDHNMNARDPVYMFPL